MACHVFAKVAGWFRNLHRHVSACLFRRRADRSHRFRVFFDDAADSRASRKKFTFFGLTCKTFDLLQCRLHVRIVALELFETVVSLLTYSQIAFVVVAIDVYRLRKVELSRHCSTARHFVS
jgi:hypothetical protein